MKNGIIGIIVIAVLIIAGILLFGGSDSSNQDVADNATGDVMEKDEDTPPEARGDLAPNFTLEDQGGNTVSLSDFRGKIAVVNSWAVWCPFCKDEIPDFADLQEEFPEEIVVIAIDRQESQSKQLGFLESVGAADRLLYLNDPSDSFYKSIGGFSMPETIFVDGEGIIKLHKRGPMSLDEMRETVLSILKENNF